MRELPPALAQCLISARGYGTIKYIVGSDKDGRHVLPVARFVGGAVVGLYHARQPDGSWARVYSTAPASR